MIKPCAKCGDPFEPNESRSPRYCLTCRNEFHEETEVVKAMVMLVVDADTERIEEKNRGLNDR